MAAIRARRRSATARRAAHANAQRAYRLRIRYGLSLERFAELVDRQGGNCGICGGPLSDEPGTPHVEHRHHGNKAVRSIAHPSCNKILGLAGESREKLIACADYLWIHEGE